MRVGFVPDSEDSLRLIGELGCEKVFTYQDRRDLNLSLLDVMGFLRPGDELVVVDLISLGGELARIVETCRRLEAAGVRLLCPPLGLVPGTALGDAFCAACAALATASEQLAESRDEPATRRRGRRAALDNKDLARALRLFTEGGMSVAEIAGRLGVSQSTIYRHLPVRSMARQTAPAAPTAPTKSVPQR